MARRADPPQDRDRPPLRLPVVIRRIGALSRAARTALRLRECRRISR